MIANDDRRFWSAGDLLDHRFEPMRWAVPGIIGEGLTLFCGPPKLGKSWACLNMGVQVAAGTPVFGKVDTAAGPVLYLALEDPPRRMQGRLRKVLDGSPPPAGLTIAGRWESLTDGGADALDAWLTDNPTCKLVIVDVFAKVRPRTSSRADPYQADYDALTMLKDVADRHQVAVLVVHHVRKASADDVLDTVSGTNGLAGAADSILIMTRSRGTSDASLFVTGRDVEEARYGLTLDARNGTCTLLDGPAEDYELGETRLTLLNHLRSNGEGTPKIVAAATGVEYETAKKTLARMADDGQIGKNGRGVYYASPTSPVSLDAA